MPMRVMVLGAAVVLAAELPAQLPAQQAGQQPARAPMVETVRTRLTQENEAEIIRVVNELRAREARILRELAGTRLDDLTARRALEQQLASTSREAFTLMSIIESRCLEQRTAAPAGYLGLNITTEIELRDSTRRVRYSTVASVEPGSPAEAAGIAAGDRLMSVGGRDTQRAEPELADLLSPGRRLPVVVDRKGATQEFTVTVAPRPQRLSAACPEYERAMQPLRMGTVARVWVRDSVDARGNRIVTVLPTPSVAAPPVPGITIAPVRTPPSPPSPPSTTTPRPSVVSVPSTPTPPAAPAAPMVFMYGVTNGATSEIAYFSGAQFRALDDDWRGVLGVRPGTDGVLVNEVAPGSAAASAGLKAGDVILSVDGTTATSPIVVARLLSLTEAPQSTLRVLRARETRTVQFPRVSARTPYLRP
ncbi:MAG: PDZ domain-containing protein [Gemmatimonadaceae bacterium]|nr:PDZ domain-containing protein [Gemmatimonadaceae bacterium]MCW5826416.1 PDZ domain-containing protein [Gemmatimonadaceae bacterium]